MNKWDPQFNFKVSLPHQAKPHLNQRTFLYHLVLVNSALWVLFISIVFCLAIVECDTQSAKFTREVCKRTHLHPGLQAINAEKLWKHGNRKFRRSATLQMPFSAASSPPQQNKSKLFVRQCVRLVFFTLRNHRT